jgi:hypothetical protein
VAAPTSGSPDHGSNAAASDPWNERANHFITAQLDTLAERIMELHFERRPELVTLYNARQRDFYFNDSRHNLTALAASILLLTPDLFGDHMAWVENLLKARGIPTAGLKMHLECMKDVLSELLPHDLSTNLGEYIDAGLLQLNSAE